MDQQEDRIRSYYTQSYNTYIYLLTSKLEQKVPIEPGTKMILYSDELLLVRISNQQVFCGCFKMIFILFIHNVDLYTHSILIHVTWKL